MDRTMRIFPGMTFVQKLIGLSRSTMRKAALVVAATQIVLGTAPLTESEARSTSAHVEASGVDLHHAHNEQSCLACIACKVFGGADVEQSAPPAIVVRTRATAATPDTFDPRFATGLARSRAPPSSLFG